MMKYLIFVILILSQFSINAEGVKLNCSPSKLICNNCPEHQTLFPITSLDESSTSLDIEANNSEMSGDDTYLFRGDVELKTDTHYLAADEIQVDQSNEITTAKGKVKFQDESFIISSSELDVRRKDGIIIATTSDANYQNINSGNLSPNGFAKEITKKGTSLILKNTTYCYFGILIVDIAKKRCRKLKMM